VLRQNFGDRRRQRRLAMINVTNGPNVHVRLTALEFLLGHSVRSSNQILEIELLPKLLRPFCLLPLTTFRRAVS
jgi:hypothetical protein